MPAAARARDELVGCFSFELVVVGWFLEGEWPLCMRKALDFLKCLKLEW